MTNDTQLPVGEECNVVVDAFLTTIPPTSQSLQGLPAWLPRHSPAQVYAAGPISLLNNAKTGFVCSSQCPGSIVLKTFDVITKMRDEGQILIGGFHSVMEWECLRILLRGRQLIIWVPARSIVGMRLKPELQPAFKDGRLLILSPFAPSHANNRVTATLAQQRNRFVSALADRVFVPHAAPASRSYDLCRDISAQGKSIVTIDDPLNEPLVQLSGVEQFEMMIGKEGTAEL